MEASEAGQALVELCRKYPLSQNARIDKAKAFRFSVKAYTDTIESESHRRLIREVANLLVDLEASGFDEFHIGLFRERIAAAFEDSLSRTPLGTA